MMKAVKEENGGSEKLCEEKKRKRKESGREAWGTFHSAKDLSSGSVWPF